MVWRSIKDVVPLLSKEFRAVHQKFKVKLLGSKRNKTRADICFSYTNNILGPMLGALFIRSAFGPSSKEKVGNAPTSHPVPLVLFAPGPLSFWLREIWERDWRYGMVLYRESNKARSHTVNSRYHEQSRTIIYCLYHCYLHEAVLFRHPFSKGWLSSDIEKRNPEFLGDSIVPVYFERSESLLTIRTLHWNSIKHSKFWSRWSPYCVDTVLARNLQQLSDSVTYNWVSFTKRYLKFENFLHSAYLAVSLFLNWGSQLVR